MSKIVRSMTGEILDDCHALGIVGEDDLALGIYVIGASRKLDEPLAGIVQGLSSSGKSHVVTQIAPLFPKSEVIEATRLSAQAVYYMGSLAHKFVVAGDPHPQHGEARKP